MNGPWAGGGLCLAPQARPDDGRLDLALWCFQKLGMEASSRERGQNPSGAAACGPERVSSLEVQIYPQALFVGR